jgi:MFS family permease
MSDTGTILAVMGRRQLALATWGLFVGLTAILLSGGIFSTLLAVRAELQGVPTLVSGGITAAYYAGFLFGSRYALRALREVGHIRVYAALGALLAAAVMLLGLTDQPVAWLALRAITGVSFAGLYVVAESWLNGLATNDFRGRLLAVYAALVVGAYGVGELVVFGFDPRGATGFSVAAVIAALAVLPVTVSVEATTPPTARSEHFSMREVARRVPTGAVGSMLVGLSHGAMLGLTAVWATRGGLGVGRTGILLAAIGIGGMALTWPISAASDDIDRRAIGVVTSLGAAGAAFAMLSLEVTSWWMVAVIAAVGGFNYPLYSIVGAYTNDWVEPEHLGAAASMIVTLYGVGAMAGPLVAAGFMEVLGDDGYPWSLVVLNALIALFFAYRIRAWHAPLMTRPLAEAGVPARAFFVPATIVVMGARRRRSRRRSG